MLKEVGRRKKGNAGRQRGWCSLSLSLQVAGPLLCPLGPRRCSLMSPDRERSVPGVLPGLQDSTEYQVAGCLLLCGHTYPTLSNALHQLPPSCDQGPGAEKASPRRGHMTRAGGGEVCDAPVLPPRALRRARRAPPSAGWAGAAEVGRAWSTLLPQSPKRGYLTDFPLKCQACKCRCQKLAGSEEDHGDGNP